MVNNILTDTFRKDSDLNNKKETFQINNKIYQPFLSCFGVNMTN
jgi:hypothetical protein